MSCRCRIGLIHFQRINLHLQSRSIGWHGGCIAGIGKSQGTAVRVVLCISCRFHFQRIDLHREILIISCSCISPVDVHRAPQRIGGGDGGFLFQLLLDADERIEHICRGLAVTGPCRRRPAKQIQP